MARRPTPPPEPERPNLTVGQKGRCIERIQRCIAELETFDPTKVQKRYREPEVMRLEAAIDEALSAAFGHGTPAYKRYSDAATLDHGTRTIGMSSSFGRGPQVDHEAEAARQARKYLAEGKQQSIVLLGQAVRTLGDEIADQEALSNSAAASSDTAQRPLDLSKVFIVHGHDGAPKAEVARFIEKLGFEAIILHERPNKGRTIITKFREEADGVGFAVVLDTRRLRQGRCGGRSQSARSAERGLRAWIFYRKIEAGARRGSGER